MMMMVKEQRPSTGFPELMLVSAGFQYTASAHLISSTYHPSIKGEHCKLNNHGRHVGSSSRWAGGSLARIIEVFGWFLCVTLSD